MHPKWDIRLLYKVGLERNKVENENEKKPWNLLMMNKVVWNDGNDHGKDQGCEILSLINSDDTFLMRSFDGRFKLYQTIIYCLGTKTEELKDILYHLKIELFHWNKDRKNWYVYLNIIWSSDSWYQPILGSLDHILYYPIIRYHPLKTDTWAFLIWIVQHLLISSNILISSNVLIIQSSRIALIIQSSSIIPQKVILI